MKTCSRCKQLKDESEFRKDHKHDGLRHCCKVCSRASDSRRYHLGLLRDLEQRKVHDRQYYTTHKEQALARWRKRRARLLGAKGVATSMQIAQRWAMWGNRCWICGDAATATDHFRPLNSGGSNHPANLRPCCRDCNLRRKKKWHGVLDALDDAITIRINKQIRQLCRSKQQ